MKPYPKSLFLNPSKTRRSRRNSGQIQGFQTGSKIYVNKAFVYGVEGNTKTKKSKRYVDCIPFARDAVEEQLETSSKESYYLFLTRDGYRMSPDHFRNEVWAPALDKAGLEYRPPIQTRHTFATMVLSAGEDVGWVQNMMGHSSLQMIFTRYYAWIPKKTRADGSAFTSSVASEDEVEASAERREREESGKVVYLFGGKRHQNDTSIKKGL